jgi:nicotinic acid phosphoribosyltransferase
VASLRHGDREVVVLRCDSASKGKWVEHVQEKLDDKTLKVLIRITFECMKRKITIYRVASQKSNRFV